MNESAGYAGSLHHTEYSGGTGQRIDSPPNLNLETLQRLMRQRSFTTTMGYINLSSQMNQASDSFLVPEILRSQSAAAKPKPNAGTPQKEAKQKRP